MTAIQELLHELTQQPAVQTRLREELITFELQHGRAPGYTDLVSASKSGLEYLEAVTMETLRCKAVLMFMSREVRMPIDLLSNIPSH